MTEWSSLCYQQDLVKRSFPPIFHKEESVEWMANYFLGQEENDRRGGRLMGSLIRYLADPGFQREIFMLCGAVLEQLIFLRTLPLRQARSIFLSVYDFYALCSTWNGLF